MQLENILDTIDNLMYEMDEQLDQHYSEAVKYVGIK